MADLIDDALAACVESAANSILADPGRKTEMTNHIDEYVSSGTSPTTSWLGQQSGRVE